MTTEPSSAARRAICDRCGARGWLEPDEIRVCSECGGPYRRMAPLEGLVDRWFAPPAQHVSDFYPRHLKLIELMWTAEGRGREMYEALSLQKVSYSQFVARATQLVVRGLAEGWIEADLPPAPTADDQQYRIRFVDPDRWADELTQTFVQNLLVDPARTEDAHTNEASQATRAGHLNESGQANDAGQLNGAGQVTDASQLHEAHDATDAGQLNEARHATDPCQKTETGQTRDAARASDANGREA